jgi:hypothetical protein
VTGISPFAFELRSGETELSVTWIEHFEGSPTEKIHRAVRAFRRSFTPHKRSVFARGMVAKIKEACETFGYTVRIIHDPEPESGNTGHTLIHRWPADELELFELLATEAWSEFFHNRDVPAEV